MPDDPTGKSFDGEATAAQDEDRQLAELEAQAADAQARAAEARNARLTEAQRAKLAEQLENPQTVTETGEVAVIDPGGDTSLEVWAFDSLDYEGDTWHYRTPKPLASMFLGITARRQSTGRQKLEAIMGFLEHVLSPASFVRIQDRAFSHDDDFDTRHMSELVSKIMTASSARPTG